MEEELRRQIQRLTLQVQESQKLADEETRRRQEAEQQQQQTQQQLQQTQQKYEQVGKIAEELLPLPFLRMLNPFPSFHSQVNSGPWPPTNEKQTLWL